MFCLFFFIIVAKGIIRMKILLVPFKHYCKRYHTNENITCYFFEKFNNRHDQTCDQIVINRFVQHTS